MGTDSEVAKILEAAAASRRAVANIVVARCFEAELIETAARAAVDLVEQRRTRTHITYTAKAQ